MAALSVFATSLFLATSLVASIGQFWSNFDHRVYIHFLFLNSGAMVSDFPVKLEVGCTLAKSLGDASAIEKKMKILPAFQSGVAGAL